MYRKPSLLIASAAALLFAAGGASAQNGTGTSTGTGTGMSSTAPMKDAKLSGADGKFVHEAAETDHMEIASAKVALGKAQSAEVKKYAQTMIDDHTKTSGELSALASPKGAKLPSEPSLTQKAKMKLLSARDGASFDKHYADEMVAGHENALKMFKKEAADGKDADLKAWAAKTVPALEHHLQMAKDLKASTAKS